jgi:hypothetical protein
MTKGCRAILILASLALCASDHVARAAIKSENEPANAGIPELRPPHGPIEEPLDQKAHWPWFVAAGALAAGAILLWPRKPRVVVHDSPAVTARRALAELRHPDPVVLGQILREYIIATHAVPGPGQTFEQLARVLEQDPRWTPALRQRFRELADPLEIAKFAPGATAGDLQVLRERALSLIEDADALNRPAVPLPQ